MDELAAKRSPDDKETIALKEAFEQVVLMRDLLVMLESHNQSSAALLGVMDRIPAARGIDFSSAREKLRAWKRSMEDMIMELKNNLVVVSTQVITAHHLGASTESATIPRIVALVDLTKITGQVMQTNEWLTEVQSALDRAGIP